MPFSINGIGTGLTGYRAPISWVERKFWSLKTPTSLQDHDAVVCFVFALLPLVPLRPVHTFAWDGVHYQQVKLRWSWGLVLGAMAQTWGMALVVCGFLTASVALLVASKDLTLTIGAATVGLTGLGLRAFVRAQDQRTRDVRIVLGPHPGGSSDPALWHPELLTSVPQHSVADGAVALDRGDYASAMFTARVLVGRGEAEGEALTQQILSHPVVAGALQTLRKAPWRRDELLR